ncbi:MAG: ParB/RepB/Spo0J family partition protein [Planctomycetia bacterium]|nr:ParB/RepB/Spo0J family partition protein [Planctomycetia bacterium]
MSKEKRLGRGLEALLGKVAAAQPVPPAGQEMEKRPFTVVSGMDEPQGTADQYIQEMMSGSPVRSISIGSIDTNPYQPRQDFDPDRLRELSSSLQQHGMIQPIVVREKSGRYELIVGERRWRAAKMAGWTEVPAYLMIVDDQEMAELALTENMVRSDLNPIEKAYAFRNYLDLYGGTHEELAKRLDLDRSTITNLMRLLDLPEELQTAVRGGSLSHSHARTLLPLDEAAQLDCAARILEENWSVRQTEDFVKKYLAGEADKNDPPIPGSSTKTSENDPQIRDLEQRFRNSLGMKVKLTANQKGKGKLVIQFSDAREFDRVFQLICPKKS